MSTTPPALTSTNGSPLRLGRLRRRRHRSGRLIRAKCPMREYSTHREDHERVHTVKGPDERDVLTDPREQDLNHQKQGEREVPPDTRPANPGAECEQKENDRAEEDDVAKPGVEVETVVERLLVDELARIVVRRS